MIITIVNHRTIQIYIWSEMFLQATPIICTGMPPDAVVIISMWKVARYRRFRLARNQP